MSLCSACTSNYSHQPIFKYIIFGLADGYFMEKMGFKKFDIALKKAWDLVTNLPYWQENIDKWTSFEEFLTHNQSEITHNTIFK